jgi:hypothetical protein
MRRSTVLTLPPQLVFSGFMILTPGADPIDIFWSKFTHSFCKISGIVEIA